MITAYDIESRAALFMSNADAENSKFRFWKRRGDSGCAHLFSAGADRTDR